jgi:hypothetical protein
MQSKRVVVLGILLAIIGAVVGAAAVSSGAQTGQSPAPGQMPPGHPPTGGGAPLVVTPPQAGSGTGATALSWTAPAAWIKETPSSRMRRAQYRIEGPGGPAECVVFYFGPGEGGAAKANAQRWAGQFRRPDGSPAGNALKTRDIKVGGLPVLLVEVAGTYVGGMGSGPAGGERANHMLLGAIAEGPDANWFFRAIGPRATLEAQRGAFDRMIRSIKRGQTP